MTNPNALSLSNNTRNPDDTQVCLWIGKNESLPYKNWQVSSLFVSSFNSFFLTLWYECTHGARRAWKMLSIMEDMMPCLSS